MATGRVTPKSIDEYIALFSPEVQAILKTGEGGLTLCGREGQSAISTRSSDPIQPDRTDCEAPSEAELCEGGGNDEEETITGEEVCWMPMSEYVRALRAKIGTTVLEVPTVSVLTFDESERVLLVRHVEGNAWTTPGGMIEPYELPADAAVREMWEEPGSTSR